jgi:sugar phosphate isomerase/epimerase
MCFGAMGIAEIMGEMRALDARRVSFYMPQPTVLGTAVLREMLDAAGQKAETVTHVFRNGALAPRAAEMREETEKLAEVIEASAAIGARSIYMMTGGRGAMHWEQAAEVYAEAIAPCLPQARAAGVALAIENAQPYLVHAHLGHTLHDSITLAEIAGIGLCMDLYCCWTEADLHARIKRAIPMTVLVQVSDYTLGDASFPSRTVPGDGAIPYKDLLGWVLEAGYTGNFDFELIGPRIAQEGPANAIRRAGEVVGKMLTDLGV